MQGQRNRGGQIPLKILVALYTVPFLFFVLVLRFGNYKQIAHVPPQQFSASTAPDMSIFMMDNDGKWC
jgi:hypothetical protein